MVVCGCGCDCSCGFGLGRGAWGGGEEGRLRGEEGYEEWGGNVDTFVGILEPCCLRHGGCAGCGWCGSERERIGLRENGGLCVDLDCS